MGGFGHIDATQLDLFKEATYSVNEKTLCFPDSRHFCKYFIPQSMPAKGIYSGICLNPAIPQDGNNNRIQNLTACPGAEYITIEPKKEVKLSNINKLKKGREKWK